MSELFDPGVECCEVPMVHRDLVSEVREKLPEENRMQDLAELFKVFGDTTRIRILFVLNMTQSAISHQLRLLKSNGLIRARRQGKSVFYSLADDHVSTIMKQGWEHIME